MTTAQGPMAKALAAALKTANPPPSDGAAVQLAKQYAELIDRAAPAAKYREALELLAAATADASPRVAKALWTVTDALAEHSVHSDLGPKLHALLTALGMTAAGRGVGGGATNGPRVPDELAALRDSAGRRRGTR